LRDEAGRARLRHLTLILTGAAMVIAAILAAIVRITIDSISLGTVAEFTAAVLLGSVIFARKGRFSNYADLLGAVVLVWLSGIICGLISLMALRLHLPVVDRQLLALDHLLGIDTVGVARSLSHLPWNVMIFIQLCYKFTVPVVFVSLIGVALLGDRLEAWRAAFCFVGSLLTVCIISIATPARGLGVWVTDADLSSMPAGALRYAFHSFDHFYLGHDPVLQVKSIDAVVCFPSFHAIMGLIVLAIWRRRPAALPLAIMWLVGMLTGTLAVGGHYVIDLLAGAVTWAAWFALSLKLAPRERPEVLGGSNSAIVR